MMLTPCNANQSQVFVQKVLITSIVASYVTFRFSMGFGNSNSVRLRKSSSRRLLQKRCSSRLQFGLGARLAIRRRTYDLMEDVDILVMLEKPRVLILQKPGRVHLVFV